MLYRENKEILPPFTLGCVAGVYGILYLDPFVPILGIQECKSRAYYVKSLINNKLGQNSFLSTRWTNRILFVIGFQ